MANSKIPQFGSWGPEENVGYTAYFETARKGKSAGPMINPNDPHMNSDMLPPARPAAAPQPTKHESKQPKFGQWEADEEVPYTAYFENTGRGNKRNPNDPQMNRDVPPQARPAAKKPEPKQPKFGEWEAEEEVPYTAYFENTGKGNKRNPNEPQMSRDVPHQARPATPPQEPKQPKFGEWDAEEEVLYTAYFESTGKGKKNPNEPQMNRDMGASVATQPAPSAANASARPSAVKFQSPIHPRMGGGRGGGNQPTSFESVPGAPGRVAQKPPVRAANNQPVGGGGPSIPAFGGWNNNPGQADNYTVVFDQHQKDRRDGPGGATPTRDARTTPGRGPIQQQPKDDFFTRLCRCFSG